MAASAVVLVAAFVGGWMSTAVRARDRVPALPAPGTGNIEVPGLARAVRIDRDRHGVPHIDAASERDAFFALGYCQAQDRLAQLAHLRRRALGTAAQVSGPEALAGD